MKNKYYAVADLNNGILEVFENLEDAETALSELIEEGNKFNEEYGSDYEDQGLDIPNPHDFYSLVEVDQNGETI